MVVVVVVAHRPASSAQTMALPHWQSTAAVCGRNRRIDDPGLAEAARAMEFRAMALRRGVAVPGLVLTCRIEREAREPGKTAVFGGMFYKKRDCIAPGATRGARHFFGFRPATARASTNSKIFRRGLISVTGLIAGR